MAWLCFIICGASLYAASCGMQSVGSRAFTQPKDFRSAYPGHAMTLCFVVVTGLLPSLIQACNTATKQLQQPQLLQQQLGPALSLSTGCLHLLYNFVGFWPGKVFEGNSLAVCVTPAAELAAAVLQAYSQQCKSNSSPSTNASNSSKTSVTSTKDIDGWSLALEVATAIAPYMAASWGREARKYKAQHTYEQQDSTPGGILSFWAGPAAMYLLLVAAATLPCMTEQQDSRSTHIPPYHLQLLDSLGLARLPGIVPFQGTLTVSFTDAATAVDYALGEGLHRWRLQHDGSPAARPKEQSLALMRVLLQHAMLSRSFDVLNQAQLNLRELMDGYCRTAAGLRSAVCWDEQGIVSAEAAAKGRAALREVSAALAEPVLLHLPGAVRDIINKLSSKLSSKLSDSNSGELPVTTPEHISVICAASAAIIMPTMLTGYSPRSSMLSLSDKLCTLCVVCATLHNVGGDLQCQSAGSVLPSKAKAKHCCAGQDSCRSLATTAADYCV